MVAEYTDVPVTSRANSVLKALIARIYKPDITIEDDVERLSNERFETPPLRRKNDKKPAEKRLHVILQKKKVSWNEKQVFRGTPAIIVTDTSRVDDVIIEEECDAKKSNFYDDIDEEEDSENECSDFAYKCVVLGTAVAVMLLVVFYFLILAFNPELVTSQGNSTSDVTTQISKTQSELNTQFYAI